MVRIVDKTPKPLPVEFNRVAIGSFFVTSDASNLYQRIPNMTRDGHAYNAVRTTNGDLACFSNRLLVEGVDVSIEFVRQ